MPEMQRMLASLDALVEDAQQGIYYNHLLYAWLCLARTGNNRFTNLIR